MPPPPPPAAAKWWQDLSKFKQHGPPPPAPPPPPKSPGHPAKPSPSKTGRLVALRKAAQQLIEEDGVTSGRPAETLEGTPWAFSVSIAAKTPISFKGKWSMTWARFHVNWWIGEQPDPSGSSWTLTLVFRATLALFVPPRLANNPTGIEQGRGYMPSGRRIMFRFFSFSNCHFCGIAFYPKPISQLRFWGPQIPINLLKRRTSEAAAGLEITDLQPHLAKGNRSHANC